MVIVGLVAIPFAVANRDDVTVDLWPLPIVDLQIPLYAIVLLAGFVGFIGGAAVGWLSAGGARRRARNAARRAQALEKDLTTLGEKIDDLRPFDPDLVARVIAGVA